MRINVRGGTAKTGVNLCLGCKSHEAAEFHSGRIYRKCCSFDRILHGPVSTCTEYLPHNHQSMYDLKEMAWVITPGKMHLGFRKLSHLEDKDKDWDIDGD